MAKKEQIKIEVDRETGGEISLAIQGHIDSLDKIMASCFRALQTDAAGKIKKSMQKLVELKQSIDEQLYAE